MQGQWLGDVDGPIWGSLRLELEDRGATFVGHAYLFYDRCHDLPGFLFPIQITKTPPYVADVKSIYLYADGGIMTQEDRLRTEAHWQAKFGNVPMPASLHVSLTPNEAQVTVDWTAEGNSGSLDLYLSDPAGSSSLEVREELKSWSAFREWAVSQVPRRYIFRGQSKPQKLATTFHRTWRKDLNRWINDDVRILFGSILEQLSYPLELGKLEHNSAIWSILQHHGYPTPLLDWTFSPFVAAYFACQNAAAGGELAPRIFIFDKESWEKKYGRNSFFVDAAPPQLVALESLSVSNPRAASQQALSTVSNVADIESFVRRKEIEDGCTYLTACDLPVLDAPQIARELELMGITYGSLFPGLDGICRDMKDRFFATGAVGRNS